MDCNPSFGQKVRAFEVDTLTKTGYVEHEIPESPVLEESGSGWNGNGMHFVDPWWTGDRWIAGVDGTGVYNWCIGIYHTPIFVYVNQSPVLSSESPSNSATSIPIGNITLTITANDPENDAMDVTFTTNASGSWTNIGTNSSVPDGTYSQIYEFLEYNKMYWWSVNATDPTGSGNWTNETYYFTTETEPIPQPPVLSNESPNNNTIGINTGTTILQIDANDPDDDLMNITFRTNATGTWTDIGTNNSVSNGTYSQIYEFLEYNKIYWWSVNATDPTGSGNWTNETYNFRTESEELTGWPYFRKITIHHDNIDASLMNFPVLIKINDDENLN